MEHGPKFDKVIDEFFQAQLQGRARKPEDHAKILRKLAGIKEAPKKIEEKKKPEKGKKKSDVAPSNAPVPAKAASQPAPAPPHAKPADKKSAQHSSGKGHKPVAKASVKPKAHARKK